MLNKEEIKQLHNNLKVLREYEIAGVSFVVQSFTWSMEEGFTESFSDLEKTDNDLYLNNFVASEILKQCLVSFNGEQKSEEEIDKFSIEKVNFIVDKYRELSQDILEYLEGFDTQPVDTKEVEEYILTDKITRTITFEYDEDVPPIKIKYRMLNIGESKEAARKITEALKDKERKMNIQMDYIRNTIYALKTIESINGIELNEKNIKDVSVEIIKTILQRLEKLEKDIIDKLGDGKKAGEEVKN